MMIGITLENTQIKKEMLRNNDTGRVKASNLHTQMQL